MDELRELASLLDQELRRIEGSYDEACKSWRDDVQLRFRQLHVEPLLAELNYVRRALQDLCVAAEESRDAAHSD